MAIALNQAGFQTAGVVGPAIGGLLIATVGAGGAYLVDVVTYGASLAALLAIAPIAPLQGVVRPGFAAVAEGLRFARSRPAVLGTFIVDLDAMIFGMPQALFPVLALTVFHAGADPPATASRTSAKADVVSAVFRATILQLATPDELRGRLSALHGMVVTAGPRVGDMEATAVATAVSAQFSVVTGGLACLVGLALIAWRLPELGRYHTTREPVPTLQQTAVSD